MATARLGTSGSGRIPDGHKAPRSTRRLLTITDFRQHLLDRHELDTAAWTVLADLRDAHDRLHVAAAGTPIHRHRGPRS